MKLALLMLVALFGAAIAQISTRCNYSPSRWGGYLRETRFGTSDPDATIFRFAQIYYDRTGQRIRIMEYERKENGNDLRVDELILFAERIRYREVSGAPCEKESIDRPFLPIDVPSYAAFLGVDVLGYGSYSLKVDHFRVTDANGDFKSYQSWAPLGTTDFYCVPVYLSFASEEGPFPERSNEDIEFFNITTIVPLDAFERPAICPP
jgi:hypothetical protein